MAPLQEGSVFTLWEGEEARRVVNRERVDHRDITQVVNGRTKVYTAPQLKKTETGEAKS